MNKRVAEKIRKDQRTSMGLVVLGVALFIGGFFLPAGRSGLWGMALGLTITGVGTYLTYQKAKNAPDMQENILMEIDERNQSINVQAAAKAFWLSFYWLAFAGLCAAFQWIPAQTLLIASLFVMLTFYISISIYYHRVK
jgi:hypothetical protein